MKKKKRFIILGGILISIVITATIFFVVYSGKDNKLTSTVDLNGTWCVYQYAENKIDNEFMVFKNGTVADYRDGNNDPYISSAYTYEDGTLKMDEISKEFAVRIVSDNNIILIEPDTREWKMIRVADAGQDISALSTSDLVGEYDVIMMAGERRINETMIFTDSTFIDTRDGSEYLSSSYELMSDHLLNAIGISREYYVYKNGSVLLLIDKSDGYVWELLSK